MTFVVTSTSDRDSLLSRFMGTGVPLLMNILHVGVHPSPIDTLDLRVVPSEVRSTCQKFPSAPGPRNTFEERIPPEVVNDDVFPYKHGSSGKEEHPRAWSRKYRDTL